VAGGEFGAPPENLVEVHSAVPVNGFQV